MASAPNAPLQLSRIPSVRLHNKDDWVEHGESLRAQVTLIRSKGRFDFTGQFVPLDGFSIRVTHWGCHATFRGQMSGHLVTFPLRGRNFIGRHGRSESGERAVILGPESTDAIEVEPGFSNLVLTFEPSLIREHLCTLVGTDRVDLALDPIIDLKTGSGMYLQRLAQFIAAEVTRDPSSVTSPQVFAGLRESFIHALLATQLRSSVFEPPPIDPGERRVQLLEGYIEEHLDEPLTLGMLAEQVGVSIRAVQLAFRRHRGLTPRKFIRERRLERAAKMLRTGGQVMTVLDVALDCGFSHTGRFARSYRQRFGELPRETLRRSGHDLARK